MQTRQILGASGNIVRFTRKHEHNGVTYTISNDAEGRVYWAFDAAVEVPFRGDAGSLQDAHDAARAEIDRMRGRK